MHTVATGADLERVAESTALVVKHTGVALSAAAKSRHTSGEKCVGGVLLVLRMQLHMLGKVPI